MSDPKWLGWVQQIQALAQDGLAYTQNPFDIERYQALRRLSAQIMAAYGQSDLELLERIFAAEAGYATPKLDARGAVFQDDKLLMVLEKADGGWTLPGGWVDVGESPRSAVEREVREESGYEARAVKLAMLIDRNAPQNGHPPYIFHLYKLFFVCELTGGSPLENIETSGAAFFAEDEIPPLSTARTTRSEIQRLFEHYRHPHLPTDFD